MAGNRVKFDTTLKDGVSSGLDKIRDKFDLLDKRGSLAGNVGAKAVAKGFSLIQDAVSAVVGVLGDAKAAYQEDQASQSQLDAALRANVASYNGNAQAIEKVLASRIRLGFSDDEQRASLASLVTRTKNASKALDLQRTAMDLARLRGIDLASATDLMGKAFSGQVGALRRAGIAVKENATAEEALLAVKEAVRGQAEAYANTDAGREAAAHQRVQEAMEKVGAVVSQLASVALPLLADAFTFVVDTVGLLVQGAQDLLTPLAKINDFIGTIPGPWKTSMVDIARATAEAAAKVDERMAYMSGAVKDDSVKIRDDGQKIGGYFDLIGRRVGKLKDDLAGVGIASEAYRQGLLAGGAIAKGITERRDAVDDAWLAVLEGIKHPISVTKETAKLLGRLVSTKLVEGLKSEDPAVRAQSEYTKQLILDRLAELEPRAGTLSQSAMDAVTRGMKSKDPDIRAASQKIYDAIHDPIKPAQTDAKAWGNAIGKGLIAGLNAQAAAVGAAAGNLANIIAAYLETHSPAKLGPLSKSGGPEGWGERVGTLFGAGLQARLPDLSAVMVPSLPVAGGPETLIMGGTGGYVSPNAYAPASGGRGSPVVIKLLVDGRELSSIVDERLQFSFAGAARSRQPA